MMEWVNKRQGADIQSKVEQLEELNQSLRNRAIFFVEAYFTGATFSKADFGYAVFSNIAAFYGATFSKEAVIRENYEFRLRFDEAGKFFIKKWN